MPDSPRPITSMEFKDGRSWRIGTDAELGWINAGLTPGLSVASSIPQVFAAYATLVFPLNLERSSYDMRDEEDRFDDALIRVLRAHTLPQDWWLGFLDTGASDVVMPNAPPARVYSGWSYVLVQAGPDEARSWRGDEGRWFTALPELIFPTDRSWLLSSLWDDAWASVGGSADLITALLNEPELRAAAERTDPSVPDMWPSSLPDEMHRRLKR